MQPKDYLPSRRAVVSTGLAAVLRAAEDKPTAAKSGKLKVAIFSMCFQ